MGYPKLPDSGELIEQVALLAQLKHEYGADGIQEILSSVGRNLKKAAEDLKRLPIDKELAAKEPNDLKSIRALRPNGPRKLWDSYDEELSLQRTKGALLARMAGCTLGAPVEFWSIDKMKALSEENGQAFPPTEYWSYVPDPAGKRYGMSPREAYTRDKMSGVPVDDDIAYTLLGLLIVEKYGPAFSTADVGNAWLKYLPTASSAEKVALDNLRSGVPADEAADRDNPYCEWIGADIRSDPWAYVAPGWPELAAELAYRDAMISHRRQGVYGEMFFAAAISAAFAVDDPVAALRIGLTEIPKECAMAKAVRWALKVAPEIKDYQQARDAVEKRFKGMHAVHTINNACLTIWGITIGGTALSRVISETVAMGMDNDCTAATAGSLVGAVVGAGGIAAHWTDNFNDVVHSYLTGRKRFTISSLVNRFARQAERVWNHYGSVCGID